MVSYDPESFDRPVRDYAFKDIDSPARLIDQMSEAWRLHSFKTG